MDNTLIKEAILNTLSESKWIKREVVFKKVIKRYPAVVSQGEYKYLHWALDELETDEMITSKPTTDRSWSYKLSGESK